MSAALGRALTPAEIRNIDNKIGESLDELRRAQPQEYAAMSGDDRLREAANLAQEKLLVQAEKNHQRDMLSIIKHHKNVTQMREEVAKGKTGAQAVGKILNQAEIYSKGVVAQYLPGLVKVMAEAHPRFWGLIENKEQAKVFAHEVLNHADGTSGDKDMQAAAKAWIEQVSDPMRERFNRAGGNVGKLEEGYLPSSHSPNRIRDAGESAWTQDVTGWVDRDRYVNMDGSKMTDAQFLTEIGKPAFTTLTTGGINKIEPGGPRGSGMRANQGSEHRVLHWKDAESYQAYNDKYGQRSTFDALSQHIQHMGKNIGLVESLGPNTNHAFQVLDDLAQKHDGGVLHSMVGVTAKQNWAVLSGEANLVEHQRLAEWSQAARDFTAAAKLVGTAVTALGDVPTYFATTGHWAVNPLRSAIGLIQSLGKDSREFAAAAGMAGEGIIADMGSHMDTMVMETGMGKVSHLLADITMRAQLLNVWTRWIRRASSMVLMPQIGKLSRKEWGGLDPYERSRLELKGVTQEDHAVWKLAQLEDWKGLQMLTPESINAIPDSALAGFTDGAKNTAISRLLGVLADESHFASLAPDLHARTLMTGGQHRGTFWGDVVARNMALFKGYTVSMMTRHIDRMINDPQAPLSRTQYAAMMLVGGTVMAAAVIQFNQLREGKDPLNMNPFEGDHGGKFWGKAWAQGNGAGYAGDLVYQAAVGASQSGTSTKTNLLGSVMGPVAGTAAEGIGVLGQTAIDMADDKEHLASRAAAANFLYSNTPLIRIWYAKNALDHAIMNDLFEAASPGYLDKVQQRARKGWGQEFFQEPDQVIPYRMPDMGKATGN